MSTNAFCDGEGCTVASMSAADADLEEENRGGRLVWEVKGERGAFTDSGISAVSSVSLMGLLFV